MSVGFVSGVALQIPPHFSLKMNKFFNHSFFLYFSFSEYKTMILLEQISNTGIPHIIQLLSSQNGQGPAWKQDVLRKALCF